MNQLETYLSTKKDYQIFFISLIFLLLVILCLSILLESLDIEMLNDVMVKKNNWQKFFSGVFVGPLLETFIFQYLLEKILIFTSKNSYQITVLSAILFGLTHNYQSFYIFYSFTLGFYFTYLYLILLKLKRKAFLTIFLLHSIHNLLVFLQQL
ncbi:CPBP family glutamic-type intramembrane protease [Flavobacterium muglaense]|uniref:CPBP family intramembrane metalloprotease n=1 Tax=Flavobacterium muglaense TaxID=2764716 RepID=A0A923MZK5_9FLAO|nr:CPBP family glutamic-type intramembrane protease [Flavobacterium muglaense]MBC5837853.1 CPBP family intramembrane metalloprotease [Flavobacterium muglaense]MBC5844322.1 CPBP family intramembrane metalloprotease [Flavobacterium muglaense]